MKNRLINKNMIQIVFNNGIPLLFNAEDWYELRTKHRIIGEFFGSTRTSSIALPISLSPEETLLLIKKGIISLKKWNKIETAPSDTDKTKYEQQLDQMFQEQKIILKDERRKQIESRIDSIIKGRELKKDISKEEIVEKELNKLAEVNPDNIITPIYAQHPQYLKGEETNVSTSELMKYTNETKCAVYEDLWERGYFITCGEKFGGDFLVYLGDPVLFHAIYIVKCVKDIHQERNVTEIIAYGRLGNTVKKKFVLAAVEHKKVSYLSLSWIDSDFI